MQTPTANRQQITALWLSCCWISTISAAPDGTSSTRPRQIHGLLLGNLGRGHASIKIDIDSYNVDFESNGTSEEPVDEEVLSTTKQTTSDQLGLFQTTTSVINPDFDYDSATLPENVPLVEKKEETPPQSHALSQEIRKVQIKAEILKRLNLEKLPKPELIQRYYHTYPHHILNSPGFDAMQNDQPEPEFRATQIKQMIRFSQQVPYEKALRIRPQRVSSTMFFPMPLALTDSSLKKATLLYYLETPSGLENQIALFNITTNRRTKNQVVHLSKVGLVDKGHWQHIDITDETRAWTRGEWKNNLGLVAEATVDGAQILHFNNSQPVTNSSVHRMPIIKLEFNEGEYNNPRQKRSLSSDSGLGCNPDDEESRCCRYPFVLDFAELGSDFDFIISPKRYWANYCKGNCPEYILPNTPNLQLTRGLPPRAQRCCSPTRLNPLTLLYMNEHGDILQGELQGMSISSCGCG